MKACVMSAERVSGISKKTNKAYEGVVTHVVFLNGDKKEVEAVWVEPSLLPNGEFPQYGQVIDMIYDRRGFLKEVNFISNERFTLNIISAGDKH